MALMEAEGAALGRLAASYARAPGDREDLFQEIAVPSVRSAHSCSASRTTAIAHPPAAGAHDRAGEDLNYGTRGPTRTVAVRREQGRCPLSWAPPPDRQVVTLALEGMSTPRLATCSG